VRVCVHARVTHVDPWNKCARAHASHVDPWIKYVRTRVRASL